MSKITTFYKNYYNLSFYEKYLLKFNIIDKNLFPFVTIHNESYLYLYYNGIHDIKLIINMGYNISIDLIFKSRCPRTFVVSLLINNDIAIIDTRAISHQ